MERRIGCLERVSGHTYDTLYDLLFTSERALVLMVQNPTEEPYQFGVTELLLGSKLTRQWERFDRKKSAEEGHQAHEEKTFEELLSGHRFNFEISYHTVTAVKITRGWFHARLIFQISSPSNTGHTTQFTLAKNQVPEAQKLLNLALPLKVK